MEGLPQGEPRRAQNGRKCGVFFAFFEAIHTGGGIKVGMEESSQKHMG